MLSRATLLAFDFDGTLAPIRDDPADVWMNRGATALLREATQMEGVVVAVVSGRDLEDLALRIDAPGAYLVGSHGLEIRGPGGVVVRDAPPMREELDRELRADIEEAGFRLEMKKHAIALHWRGARANDGFLFRFRVWARAANLDVIEGRCVIEARSRGGGKEEALRWLAAACGTSRVIYAGDDLTDFGALRFAAERGRAVFVASSERTPPPGVTVVASFRELFRVVRDEVTV
ncbi:MAG TPA: trehalose-phosphatase [Thermoanaerobaculia bacterium]|jgi:trehalose 6-phosphate phosphatase|nr:trehalose-phosphatase [Thermoanaerobaculia bacterium]